MVALGTRVRAIVHGTVIMAQKRMSVNAPSSRKITMECVRCTRAMRHRLHRRDRRVGEMLLRASLYESEFYVDLYDLYAITIWSKKYPPLHHREHVDRVDCHVGTADTTPHACIVDQCRNATHRSYSFVLSARKPDVELRSRRNPASRHSLGRFLLRRSDRDSCNLLCKSQTNVLMWPYVFGVQKAKKKSGSWPY